MGKAVNKLRKQMNQLVASVALLSTYYYIVRTRIVLGSLTAKCKVGELLRAMFLFVHPNLPDRRVANR